MIVGWILYTEDDEKEFAREFYSGAESSALGASAKHINARNGSKRLHQSVGRGQATVSTAGAGPVKAGSILVTLLRALSDCDTHHPRRLP